MQIVQEHRFAFFFWNQWKKEKRLRPSLFSMDFHHDLCSPDKHEIMDLTNLDLSNDEDVAKFCWARLRSVNDMQTLSAAYLDILADVHVRCRMDFDGNNQFRDITGNTHNVKVYHDHKPFISALEKADKVIVDIDLDFFVTNYKEDTREKIIDSSDAIIASIEHIKSFWPKIVGITIATEPSHCGGILNSYKILKVILEYLK